jgi:hypothetical protein
MSIVHGTNTSDPGAMGKEYWLMVEMGWSWRELCDTPFFVIDEIYTRIVAKQHWTEVRRKLDNV